MLRHGEPKAKNDSNLEFATAEATAHHGEEFFHGEGQGSLRRRERLWKGDPRVHHGEGQRAGVVNFDF